ncbi:unnamed protein product [Rotaria sp. Silwood1]|nr:unnamed protein product [Rotaria sp. Silwood1]CAF4830243.1 unnamed protein product [Rotaria sp. Silwood1]
MTTEDTSSRSSSIIVNRFYLSDIQKDLVDDKLSSTDICTMFRALLTEFERMETSGITTTKIFLDAIEEIANVVLAISPYKLLDPRVLRHPLIYFLHQMLIDLLVSWRASEIRLSIQESDIFLKIVLIFVNAAEYAFAVGADEDRQRITDLLATRRFLILVREQIEDSDMHKQCINDDPNICTLGLLTIKLLQGCPFYNCTEYNACLIETLILNCLDSYDYIQAVRRFQSEETYTDMDDFLLFTCWDYMPFDALLSQSSNSSLSKIDSINHFYDELLTRFEHALDQPPITYSGLYYIFERCQQLLSIPKLPSFDKHAQIIIDHLIKMLENLSSTNSNDDALIIVALEAFYNLSKIPDIRTIMKKRHLTSLFNKYTDVEMGEKRKLAFDILAEIMDEQEINNNSSEIISVFTDQLKELNPNEYKPDIDNTLSSLQALMQYEQIKNEFIKQGGLDKLISFVCDGEPYEKCVKQLEDALKILWSCTFSNPEALNKLKQDQILMTHVNHLLEKSKQDENITLEKAAEGLIWKVEKEEKFLEEQSAEEEKKKQKAEEPDIEQDEKEEEVQKYDIMMSYSWADMDLAHRIFKHLTEKLGYRVWLDQEQMHGSTIETMANAVENAEYILMCMSDTYKRSANCQSEAEYAFKRKKNIVPIQMKEDYIPDGWLGFILGTRMYIDFEKYDFDKAIELLDNEIQLQKKNSKEAEEAAEMEEKSVASSENKDNIKEEVANHQNTTNVKVNKNNILNWNEDNVREFLLKHNLSAIAFLCQGINGEELSNLYTMCKTNSISMYRSLKLELIHSCNKILPISTYLRFMSRIRAVCDDTLDTSAQTMNKSYEHDLLDDQ